MFPICLITLLVWVNPTRACLCTPVLFGKLFCESPVVFEGTVINDVDWHHGTDNFLERPDVDIYNVTIHKVYKTDDDGITAGGVIRVFAPEQMASCGGYMESGKIYLIAPTLVDGRLSIDACSFVERMTSLTTVQMEGINGGYDCSCDHDSYWSGEAVPPNDNICRSQKVYSWWCYNDEGLCTRDGDGVCRWKLSNYNCNY